MGEVCGKTQTRRVSEASETPNFLSLLHMIKNNFFCFVVEELSCSGFW